MTSGSAGAKYKFAIVIGIASLIAIACSSLPYLGSVNFTRTRVLMGDVPVTLTVRAPSSREQAAYRAMEKGFEEMARIERMVSEYRPDSEVSLLNQNAGKKWIPISPETASILTVARQISEKSGGVFDITFASKAKNANYRDVMLNERKEYAFLRTEGVRIGLSGISKGFIVERASKTISNEGFKDNLVNAGGDIFAQGAWKIRIRNPVAGNDGETRCALTVKDRAVSTSGTYERGMHLIDPKTRQPVNNHRSTTIVADSAVEADALATAAFILGRSEIGPLMREFPKTMAFVIEEDGNQQYGDVKIPVLCKP